MAYRLGSDDKVRVTVFGETDLSGEFSVDGRGNLSLPLVGQMPVGGMSIPEAEAALVTKLKDGFLNNPRVSIDVLNYRPFYILGEIKTPGRYAYINGMTVLNAVAMGGGFTYRADKGDVKVTREIAGHKIEEKAKENSPVLPGDIIEIGERLF